MWMEITEDKGKRRKLVDRRPRVWVAMYAAVDDDAARLPTNPIPPAGSSCLAEVAREASSSLEIPRQQQKHRRCRHAHHLQPAPGKHKTRQEQPDPCGDRRATSE